MSGIHDSGGPDWIEHDCGDDCIFEPDIKELLHHISRCPLGFYGGNLIRTRGTTDIDVINWLTRLDQLAKAVDTDDEETLEERGPDGWDE